MNWKAWIGILVAAGLAAGVAYWVNETHPNWGADDFSKLLGMWLVLFAALASAWVSIANMVQQTKSAQEIADDQRNLQRELQKSTDDVQREIAKLNASLALNLEEAKLRIANRYQAQVALNQVAMSAADQIHVLQKAISSQSEAQLILDLITEALQAMQSKRGALLMVPREYRDAWENLQQQIAYIKERLANEINRSPTLDLPSFYGNAEVGGEFGTLWKKFYEVASYKDRNHHQWWEKPMS